MGEDIYKYRSNLSEEELYRLWILIRDRRPIVIASFIDPNYTEPDFKDDLTGLDHSVHAILREEHPVDLEFPQHYNMYADMKIFLGLYLTNTALKGPYHTDRN